MYMQDYTVEYEKIERDLQECLQSIKENEGEQYDSVSALQKIDSNFFDMPEITLFLMMRWG